MTAKNKSEVPVDGPTEVATFDDEKKDRLGVNPEKGLLNSINAFYQTINLMNSMGWIFERTGDTEAPSIRILARFRVK